MSFEKMQDFNEKKPVHERSCIMLYYFTPAEMKQLQLAAKLAGINDQIILKQEHGDCTLQAILDDQLTSSEGEIIKHKAIIFNNVSGARVGAFLQGLRKIRMSRPLVAVTTETSIKWPLKELLLQLNEERYAINSNRFTEHETVAE